MFSVLAMVCVTYLNGNEHCDVRFKHNYAETKVECLRRANIGVTNLSKDALSDDEVAYVTSTDVRCESRSKIELAVAAIPDYMDGSNTSYVLTEY